MDISKINYHLFASENDTYIRGSLEQHTVKCSSRAKMVIAAMGLQTYRNNFGHTIPTATGLCVCVWGGGGNKFTD